MAREYVPVTQGFSEYVIATQTEWGEHVQTTGYWTLGESSWEPAAALLKFLETGDPVFIGLGSMPVPEPQLSRALILNALNQAKWQAGVRADPVCEAQRRKSLTAA